MVRPSLKEDVVAKTGRSHMVAALRIWAAVALGLVAPATARSPYEALAFIGDGTSVDWRHEPVHAWSMERPASLWNETDYAAMCLAAIACSGDLDLTHDEGARVCSSLTAGTIRITGPLRHPPVCLTEILGGGIEIIDNDWVTSLNGFGRLTSVSGSIILDGNPHLVSLGGLDNLTSVGGDFILRNSGDALTLTRLDDLVVQERYLQNEFNSYVKDSALHFPRRKGQRTGTSVAVDALGTTVFSEDATAGLRSLHGLGNLTTIGGDLVIVSNTELLNLRGAENLAHVGGSLLLRQNLLLEYVEGLDALLDVAGDVLVEANPRLADLSGLLLLGSVGGNWTISQNEGMTEVGALSSLTRVDGGIFVYRNERLAHFSQSQPLGLTDVGGYFVVEDNRRLASLQGLNNLASVGGALIIGRNPQLTSLSNGLETLASVGGDLYIQGEMTTYVGLDGLERVEGSMVVHSMPSLTSLEGLSALQHVGKDVLMYANPVLESVSELGALRNVGARIRIYENQMLASVQGMLEALAHVGAYVRISFTNGTVDCPEGTGLAVGELPLIYDTTAEDPSVTEAAQMTSTYGNWCVFNCNYPSIVWPSGRPRMWQTQSGKMWDATQGPYCVEEATS
ncbi:Hypothetical Protein FCC1311_089342 [Hondaea fermentalgiana]|uniref:Receptor L-domain domain-containing protein n=1 Tax=Hondaea fermentalgiana TaxID=2315210 RepID=A0A2R5GQX1_9STRA|nr:Hypothetical Protein FCC1311_089342 [Hondaea fermentalgiana]|eukprot:GBG32709.1 Hypothetical Protein FCC1311_089342 [Hondaea fermentalgiana]